MNQKNLRHNRYFQFFVRIRSTSFAALEMAKNRFEKIDTVKLSESDPAPFSPFLHRQQKKLKLLRISNRNLKLYLCEGHGSPNHGTTRRSFSHIKRRSGSGVWNPRFTGWKHIFDTTQLTPWLQCLRKRNTESPFRHFVFFCFGLVAVCVDLHLLFFWKKINFCSPSPSA